MVFESYTIIEVVTILLYISYTVTFKMKIETYTILYKYIQMLILVGCKFVLCKYIQIETITMLVLTHFIAFIGFDLRFKCKMLARNRTIFEQKNNLNFHGTFYVLVPPKPPTRL
jgi:hypothetical protein